MTDTTKVPPCPQCFGVGMLVAPKKGKLRDTLCPTCNGTGKLPAASYTVEREA